MRRLLFACCCLLLGWMPMTRAEPLLRVGYFELPPHTVAAAGGEGPAQGYLRLIARRMGVALEFHGYPLARLLYKLERDELDLALILARSPERERRLSFPSEPFFLTHSALVVRAGSPLTRVERVEDLIGLRLGVWFEGYRSALLGDPRLTLVPVTGDQILDKSAQQLRAGRLDAFYHPDALALTGAAEGGDLRLLALPEPPLPLYSAFSHGAAKRWLAPYQKALAEQQAELGYEAWLARPTH